MDRPFDATLKTLAELSPADWLPLVKRWPWRQSAMSRRARFGVSSGV